jgi:hypothetical protein
MRHRSVARRSAPIPARLADDAAALRVPDTEREPRALGVAALKERGQRRHPPACPAVDLVHGGGEPLFGCGKLHPARPLAADRRVPRNRRLRRRHRGDRPGTGGQPGARAPGWQGTIVMAGVGKSTVLRAMQETRTPPVRTDEDGFRKVRRRVGNGRGTSLRISPIRTMMNQATCEVFFDDVDVPAANLIGEEGKGFRYIMSGMNAERIPIAAECIGDARWLIRKAAAYASEREVFGRPIGRNQGIQFPIAKAYARMRAAELMVHGSIRRYEAGESPGAEANMAKILAAEASWEAAETAVQTHGGFGFAEEYDIERKVRETRLYRVAPISTNLILSDLAEHVLGMPRSCWAHVPRASRPPRSAACGPCRPGTPCGSRRPARQGREPVQKPLAPRLARRRRGPDLERAVPLASKTCCRKPSARSSASAPALPDGSSSA